MTRRMTYHWHLRQLMAAQGMFATTDLGPLLAERGVSLSREQVYRLVVGTPERLSLATLAALCDILSCTPADLIEVVAEPRRLKKVAGAPPPTTPPSGRRPRRARIVTDGNT
ncbi:MAG: helix-turn-helix transcriptional regulator [Actinomycetota bacterium]|nr:helix-turn-helix transcriptional regulator [Actinomycetota bacterium]